MPFGSPGYSRYNFQYFEYSKLLSKVLKVLKSRPDGIHKKIFAQNGFTKKDSLVAIRSYFPGGK
jgi:hypothetical protein